MNCKQVQTLLVSYLNKEITPSEHALIQAHVSGCTTCQEELSHLAKIQGQLSSVLQGRAAQAIPSPTAWERLEVRLAEAAQPSPENIGPWLLRLALGVGRISNQLFSGGVIMRRKLVVSALAAALIITIVAFFTANIVNPVSAKEILEHAYAAQAKVQTEGIEHIRREIHSSGEALPEDQAGSSIVESYRDLKSGNLRMVVTDSKTGQLLHVFAFDGTYAYNSDDRKDGDGSGNLTVYRTPQNREKYAKPGEIDDAASKDMFEKMRNDPNVKVKEETWADGRTVYNLQSQLPQSELKLKGLVEGGEQSVLGLVNIYFDANTYRILGHRLRIEKNGQEILTSSEIIPVAEILPADSRVAWDLSDLPGITIVDRSE